MAQIHGLQPGRVMPQQADAVHQMQGPAALQQARPGRVSAGRIAAAIFSFGISEGIRAIINKVQAGRAQARPQDVRIQPAALPPAQPRMDQLNGDLAAKIRGQLPPAHAAALQEAMDTLRTNFGDHMVPQTDTLKKLTSSSDFYFLLTRLETAIRRSPEEVTPQRLKELVLEQRPYLATLSMRDVIKQYCEDHHYQGINILGSSTALVESIPARKAALDACTTMDEVRTLFAGIKEAPGNLQKLNEQKEARKNALASVFTELSHQTGIPESTLQHAMDMKEFENKCNYLGQDFNDGKYPQAELKQRFTALANRFVQGKTELLHLVDQLNISDSLKRLWTDEVLRNSGLQHADEFQHIAQAGIHTDGSGIMTYLHSGHVSPQDLYGLLATLGLHVHENLHQEFTPQEWINLGGDGQGNARNFSMQAALDHTPGLREALQSLPKDAKDELMRMADQMLTSGLHDYGAARTPQGIQEAEVRKETGIFIKSMLMELEYDAKVTEGRADALTNDKILLPYAQTINAGIQNIRDRFGDGALPAGTTLKEWKDAGGDAAKFASQVQAQVRALGHEPSPAELSDILERTIRPAASRKSFETTLHTVMQNLGINTEGRTSLILDSMEARHPGFKASLSNAVNQQALLDLIQNTGDITDVCRRIQIIGEAQIRVQHQVVDRLTNTLHLTPAQASQLNLTAITSGSLAYLASDLVKESDVHPEQLCNPADINARFQAIEDRFVTRKSALFTSVDQLGLSPELNASWKQQVLTNMSLKEEGFLNVCHEIGSRMSGSTLLRGLQDPDVSLKDLTGILKAVGSQVDTIAHAVFTKAQYEEMGSDELYMVNRFSREAFLDQNPDLVAELRRDPARLTALNTILEDELSDLTSAIGRLSVNSPLMNELQRQYGQNVIAMQVLSSFLPRQ